MEIIMQNWMIISLTLVAIVVGMSLLAHKSVHSELVHPSRPEEIWTVLMDTDQYEKWNEVLIPIEGRLEKGEEVTYRMISAGGKESIVKARVAALEEARLLNQKGGFPGVLTFDHKYILEPVDDGTKVTIHEDYRGIGVLFWDPTWFGNAYEKANHALRERAEAVKE